MSRLTAWELISSDDPWIEGSRNGHAVMPVQGSGGVTPCCVCGATEGQTVWLKPDPPYMKVPVYACPDRCQRHLDASLREGWDIPEEVIEHASESWHDELEREAIEEWEHSKHRTAWAKLLDGLP